MLLCIIAVEVPAIFIDAVTKMKGMQIGDHEIKKENFVDATTTFLRDFSCIIKIELISKLCKNVSTIICKKYWKNCAS